MVLMAGGGGSNKARASAALPGLGGRALENIFTNTEMIFCKLVTHFGVSLTVKTFPLKKECLSDLYILGPSAMYGLWSGFS